MSRASTPANPGRTFDQARSCASKVPFRSYDAAQRAANRLTHIEREDDGIIRPYRCSYCGGYHVGHKP